MLIFFIIVLTIICTLLARIYAMKWWRIRESSKAARSGEVEKPKRNLSQAMEDVRAMYDRMKSVNMMGNGTDRDTIPEGFGAFGLEPTNPIPVNTLFGSISYLQRLRTMEGKPVQYIREGSTDAPNIENPIDIYEISVDGNRIGYFYISPYHKKNSCRGPKGFLLLPEISDEVFYQ